LQENDWKSHRRSLNLQPPSCDSPDGSDQVGTDKSPKSAIKFSSQISRSQTFRSAINHCAVHPKPFILHSSFFIHITTFQRAMPLITAASFIAIR
jgi:hypothetical protein